MMFVLALPGIAGGKGELQKYFSNAASSVKATDDPAEKRAILNQSFQTMSKALDLVRLQVGTLNVSMVQGIA